ncbi:hypothetical protein [Undibacterium sp. TJN19]|uniref:hypothetical protein n=1 Tax=Undibacterium sp. TJN19 TaxID=3413055 RepID=UPI003BEF985F
MSLIIPNFAEAIAVAVGVLSRRLKNQKDRANLADIDASNQRVTAVCNVMPRRIFFIDGMAGQSSAFYAGLCRSLLHKTFHKDVYGTHAGMGGKDYQMPFLPAELVLRA